ncbi:slc47a1 [Symbiodinium sp. CCMP2592]|nr:slc47a1 [Symbiodinium sp. CCMP2592]
MTMISKSLCSAEDIRVQEIVSGRVLHTRIPGYGGHNHIDLLNVYQHAWDQRAEAGELKRKRAWILAKIDACIQQIPWRNLCICAGDWNVQLEPMSDLIGNSTNIRVGQAQSAPDMASLTDVMIARQLVGLNTWTGPKRKAYTFTHNGGRTQIDFVFARKHQVTRQMRSCHALEGFPVTAWRQSGLHRPLQVSLDYRWIPSSTPQQSRRIDHDAIATAVRQCTPKLHEYQLDVQTVLARNPPRDTSALHQVLYDCCLRHFPASTQRREYAHNHAEVRNVVHSRWLHLQRGKYHRRFAAACMSSAWHCWHHFARFRALRREANKASRTARRQRYENLLQEAEKFARQQNTHKMFSIIRQLAPKQPHRKVKIYGKEGEILSRQEEVACLKKHFCDIFQGASCDWTHPIESPASPPAPETICAALERIPLRKAVPAHMAPGAAWRAAARQVTDLVHQEACKVWAAASVPQNWRDGWLALAAKPQKSGRGPADYRPLCLQDPSGKAVIGILADQIRPTVRLYANRFPQHAYLAGRSTEGALLSVFHKCREIRGLTQAAGNSVFARRSGHTAEPYTGGLILSLDMTTAFDTVPRAHVRDSLIEAGVAQSDVSIIMSWLTGATYHLKHAHINLRIITERGVRQGCPLSPLVWACFTCYIAKRLTDVICLDDLQIYADDFIWSCIFHTKQQFLHTLRTVPLFIQKLRQYGLRVNLNKTAVLIRMARQEGKALLKLHLCKTAQGTFLNILSDKPLRIPVKKSHVYLGCVISLFDFESLTVRHRIEAARNQYSRLRSVLTSTRCMSMKRRARIWLACIWSTLTYGWTCCGCSGFLFTQVCGLVTTQMRAIARSPRHIAHTTNEEVFAMLGLPGPAALMQHALENLRQRLQFVRQTDDTIMCNPTLHAQANWAFEALTDAIASKGRLERVTGTQGVACTECGIYFDTESAMRKHRTRQHPEATGLLNLANDSSRAPDEPLPLLAEFMADLTKDQIVSLFGGVLPAVSLAAGSQRPPATPQQAGRGSQKSGLTERPPKYHKHQTNGKGKGNGKGRYKDKRPREDSEHTSAQEGDNLDPQLIPLIAQLCLRFEDAINILRLDRAYVMLFKTKSEESIVKTLHDLSQRWEELKEAKQTDSAKRIALFKGMLMELQTRIKGMIEKEDKVKQLIQMGWMSKQEGREPMWLPLVWNVEQQKDVPCPDMGPLPHTKAMQALDTLLEYACGQVIHRFHPTRPLVPEHAGEILEFKMEVSLKGVAPTQVHDALTQLSNSALWLLIGARKVLRLALRNTGNTCYQNAFVMSWLWALVNANANQVGGYNDEGLGRGRNIINALLTGSCDRLSSIFAWSSIMQNWPRPQQQHDVCAFASHALAKLKTPLMGGSWEARREDPVFRVVDMGSQALPITMAIPEGKHTLRECIEAWQHQNAKHALGYAPDLLMLQLGRFRQRLHRRVRKYQGIVMLPSRVQMPCFTAPNELGTHNVDYRIISGVFHLGNTPASGHYRTFLSDAEVRGISDNPGEPHGALANAWETDDGRVPIKLDHTLVDTVLTNTYTVWLAKL